MVNQLKQPKMNIGVCVNTKKNATCDICTISLKCLVNDIFESNLVYSNSKSHHSGYYCLRCYARIVLKREFLVKRSVDPLTVNLLIQKLHNEFQTKNNVLFPSLQVILAVI